MSERAGAVLHAPLHPAHDGALGQELGGGGHDVVRLLRHEPPCGRSALDLGVVEARAEEGVVLARSAGGAQLAVRDEEGGAQARPVVPRRGLHEDLLERPLAQEAAVGDAVQSHAAGHDQLS